MEGDDANRFFSMAEVYDRMCPVLVPQYESLQAAALELIPFPKEQAITIVDLGAGSGRLLERALAAYPQATCYWVDYSEDFLKVAQKRLAAYGERVKYIVCRLEDRWEASIAEPAHAILSMSAIHHLDSDGKRSLYRRCFERLQPGGIFLNVDEMRSVHEDAYRASLQFWIRHFEDAKSGLTEDELVYYAEWKRHFDFWIARNVEGIEQPKKPGDDIHDGFLEQLHWLQEIGFRGVDLFAKYHLWSVIGGYK